jgi:predicted nucleic acid-binding protein
VDGKVTRIFKPYSSGIDAMVLSRVKIEVSDGTKCWVWYIQPSANIVGTVVKAGISIIGIAKTLKNRYKNGITDHVHVRIHARHGVKVNPVTVIK